ncbi:MAG: protein DA1 [Candidatus Sericytochromatia bacterium]|nr:protein DA1 [Candidatus Tanganyikabacteria bacterium]
MGFLGAVLLAAVLIAQLVCGYCHRPITTSYITSKGHPYHETCYVEHVAPRCVVCSQPITTDYLRDPWGNVFHREHKQDTPQCQYCSRILSTKGSRGGFVYGDGRTICGICKATAVLDDKQAGTLAKAVRKRMAGLGLSVPYGDIPLELGDRNWLAGIRAQHPGLVATRTDATAFTNTVTTTRGARVVSKKVAIYVLAGLPIEVFQGTYAHELMHARNHLVADLRHTPELEEGAANYAEALYLANLNTAAARYHLQALETSEDPIYGQGYRRVKRMVADYGFAGLLGWLETQPDFPFGY